MKFPCLNDIVKVNLHHLHYANQEQIGLDNLKEKGSLEWVLDAIQYPLFNQDFYPGIVEKAAILTRTIITGHVFWDGNKRTGISVLIAFLNLNDYEINTTPDELVDIACNLAGEWPDRQLTLQGLIIWIRERIKLINK